MSTRQILILTQCIFKDLLLHVYWKFMPESFLIFLLLLNELEKTLYSNYSICRWHLEKMSSSVSLQCRVWYCMLPSIISRFAGCILMFHCAVKQLNLCKHLPKWGIWIKWMNEKLNIILHCSMTCRSEKLKLSESPTRWSYWMRKVWRMDFVLHIILPICQSLYMELVNEGLCFVMH